MYTNECITKHCSKTIITFADYTKMISNISNNDEKPYGDEVKLLMEWCAEKNLSHDVSKTKKLVVDFRSRVHAATSSEGTMVERVSDSLTHSTCLDFL